MTLADEIANDWIHMDGIETVSLTPQNPPSAAIAGVKAMRRGLTRREIEMLEATEAVSGGFIVTDICFSLWTATLSGAEPQIGDLITDASSNDYAILTLELVTLGTRWRALARKQ